MCKYCSELFTGDSNDSLITEHIELKLNDITVESICIDIFVTDDKLELYCDSDIDDRKYVKKLIPIKFCPMCGKELKPAT